MKKLIVSLLLLIAGITAPVAFAETYTGNCVSSYGGSYNGNPNCVITTIVVNKTVKDPRSTSYVDNLGMNEGKYKPQGVVPFKISVTNNGNREVTNVEVKDIFPEHVTFESGNGTYDAASRTFTVKIDKLAVNETKIIELQGKIAGENAFPANQGTICRTNHAQALVNGQTFTDKADFCIEKSVLAVVYPQPKVTTTPATGAGALSLLALIPAGLSGLYLRRKTCI